VSTLDRLAARYVGEQVEKEGRTDECIDYPNPTDGRLGKECGRKVQGVKNTFNLGMGEVIWTSDITITTSTSLGLRISRDAVGSDQVTKGRGAVIIRDMKTQSYRGITRVLVSW